MIRKFIKTAITKQEEAIKPTSVITKTITEAASTMFEEAVSNIIADKERADNGDYKIYCLREIFENFLHIGKNTIDDIIGHQDFLKRLDIMCKSVARYTGDAEDLRQIVCVKLLTKYRKAFVLTNIQNIEDFYGLVFIVVRNTFLRERKKEKTETSLLDSRQLEDIPLEYLGLSAFDKCAIKDGIERIKERFGTEEEKKKLLAFEYVLSGHKLKTVIALLVEELNISKVTPTAVHYWVKEVFEELINPSPETNRAVSKPKRKRRKRA